MTRRAWLLAALVAAGCETGFETQSIVIDLRVIGMRADPAEIVVDVDPDDLTSIEVPPVAFRALVVDPGAPGPLEYRWIACPEASWLRCDHPDITYTLPFGEGTVAPGEEATATLQADLALLRAALEQDEFAGLGGIPVIAELIVRPPGGDPIHAAKRVFFAPRVPPERRANQNPTLAELHARGEPFSEGQPLAVARGEEIALAPVEPPGVREVYVVPTLDGGSRTFTENLRYSWLATGGSFSSELTGGARDIFGNEPRLDTRWRAPDVPGPVTLWVVQRDERGGTYWTQRIFEVQ